jgi:hypothetical protein
MSGLKILIVHNIEDLRNARASSIDHILCFQRYAGENDFLYHRMTLPMTSTIRDTDWDVVIFDSTALGCVTLRPRHRFLRLREQWDFLRNHPAYKVVMPQDDASHGGMMDHFFYWLKVDALYTVRPEHADLIYPNTKGIAAIVPTLAGYIDDNSLARKQANSKRWGERRYTVGQRITMYPAWGGKFARRKGEAAVLLHEECLKRGVTSDVSIDPAASFVGDAWFEFLGESQFVVGAEGGHSLWDPFGVFQDHVNDYVARHPEATFDEIEAMCFAEFDGRYQFPGFAPRILEAATMGCAQILVEGDYRGHIQADTHYISMRADYSNFGDIFDAMSNIDANLARVARTQRDLVDSPNFRYRTFANSFLDAATGSRKARANRQRAPDWDSTLFRHHSELIALTTAEGIQTERLVGDSLIAWVKKMTDGQLLAPLETIGA